MFDSNQDVQEDIFETNTVNHKEKNSLSLKLTGQQAADGSGLFWIGRTLTGLREEQTSYPEIWLGTGSAVRDMIIGRMAS